MKSPGDGYYACHERFQPVHLPDLCRSNLQPETLFGRVMWKNRELQA
jgi:hypothetical protein